MSNRLYYIAFGLYVLEYAFGRTNITGILFLSNETIQDLFRIMCVLLLMLKLVMERYSTTQVLAIMGVGMVTLASLFVSRDWNLVLLFFFVVAARGANIRKMACIAFCIQLGVLATTLIFGLLDYIPSVYAERYVNGIVQLRSSMGYNHPNQFGQCLLSICCSYAIMRFRRWRYVDLLIYATAFYLCYAYADSRTASACIIFVAALSLAMHYFHGEKTQKRMALASLVAVTGAMALAYYLMTFYNGGVEWMSALNSALSTRFSLAHAYFLDFPPTLLGRPVDTLLHQISATYLQHGPDCAYARILLQDGILPTAIFMGAYLATFAKLWQHGRFDACAFGMLVYAIAGVMESNSLHFAVNFGLIALSTLLYGWEDYETANLIEQPSRDADCLKDANPSIEARSSLQSPHYIDRQPWTDSPGNLNIPLNRGGSR